MKNSITSDSHSLHKYIGYFHYSENLSEFCDLPILTQIFITARYE